jgi:hypothetical protein
MSPDEQELRREAIRRRLNGERSKDIHQDFGRSTQWLNKWWSVFKNDPHTDFACRSRAPLTDSSVITPELERLVIELRQAFESANHGLIGARAIWDKLIVWCEAFWSRQTFMDLAHVQAEIPAFTSWYHHHYRPRCLEGKTPAQTRYGICAPKLRTELRRQIPDFRTERLPETAGRFHFVRKVDTSGHIKFLNERWLIGPKWIGEYVRATIDTAKQTLTISHKSSDETGWRLIKTRIFRIKESVHDLLPQFKRNRARCRDCLPG